MELNLNELRIDTYRQGPEGWMPRVSQCVRILHILSGIEVCECVDRSQHRNKAEAMRKMQIIWRFCPEAFQPSRPLNEHAELKAAWDKYRGDADLSIDDAFLFAAGFIAGRASK